LCQTSTTYNANKMTEIRLQDGKNTRKHIYHTFTVPRAVDANDVIIIHFTWRGFSLTGFFGWHVSGNNLTRFAGLELTRREDSVYKPWIWTIALLKRLAVKQFALRLTKVYCDTCTAKLKEKQWWVRVTSSSRGHLFLCSAYQVGWYSGIRRIWSPKLSRFLSRSVEAAKSRDTLCSLQMSLSIKPRNFLNQQIQTLCSNNWLV